jgi:precorrin-2 dehydrogenase/sirohydrochlorin ferrochelatase
MPHPAQHAGYPVLMQLAGRRCVVIGAGAVGRRKVDGLLAAGARVVVVAPDGATRLPSGVEVHCRPYGDADLDGAFLVFAATDCLQTNQAVAAAARRRGVPVNIADDPAASDFFLPAVLRQGRVCVAVSTDGASPAMARLLRDDLAAHFDPSWAFFVEIAGALRRRQLTTTAVGTYNQPVLHALLEQGVLRLIAAGDAAGIDRLLTTLAGGCTLATLDLSLPKGLP